MLEPTATAARSVADSRPAITASIVPLPTTARLATNSGQASFSSARDDVSGALRAAGSTMLSDADPPASATAHPDAEDLVVAGTAGQFVGQLPVADRRRVVELGALAVAMNDDRAGVVAVGLAAESY